MTVLAIDTTTEACSAALCHRGQIFRRFQIAPRQHAVLIMPMIDALLEEAACNKSDIEWVAFGRGPGAFTGVRIATGIAHGLSIGLGCGLVPVSTLEALAFGLWLEEEKAATVISCLDARMGEVYWAGYEIGGELPEALLEECVAPPTAVTGVGREPERVIGVGHGWSAHPETLVKALGYRPGRIEAERFPDAAVMLELARRRVNAGLVPMKPVDAQPVYLRDRVATPPQG